MDQIDKELISSLREKAKLVRKHIVKMLAEAGGGHFGGSLSSVEILVSLYFHILRIDPKSPRWEDRDRFVLSKGHACAALCPVLAERGFFSSQLLLTFNELDSPFGMHPDMHKIPGCDMSTGSLGHGLPVGLGMALTAKLDKKSYRVFVLLGDGELQEGSVWEAAMAAKHYRLDNLAVIVDRNGIELDGPTEEIMSLEPLVEKWRSFGWKVKEIDGHKIEEIVEALRDLPFEVNRPGIVIAHTVKGKGISFAENTHDWHYATITEEQAQRALIGLCEGKDD